MQNGVAKKWLFWLAVASLLLLFLYAIKAILLPFVIGILVAYFLDPAADKLEKWKLSRTAATATITLSFFAIIALAIAILLPLLLQQVTGLLSVLPTYIQELQILIDKELQHLMGSLDAKQIESAKEAVHNASSEAFASTGVVLAGVWKSGFALINLASLLVITPVVSFYLLRDWDKITACTDRLLPRAHADTIREQIAKIDETMAGFLRGTVNVMIVLGLFYSVALSIVDLDFAILIGIMGGIIIIIPYLGTILTGLTAIGVAYLQHEGAELVMMVTGIFIAGQMLEGYVLTPKLVGERVGLHPLWLIFGMLAGAALFGVVGVFLAVPVTAVIGVLVRFAISQYQQSGYYDPACEMLEPKSPRKDA